MSAIRETLERIEVWLELNYLPGINALQPGLTLTEIQERIKELPFDLPTEVFELYQWRNGTKLEAHKLQAMCFDSMIFCSLNYVIERTKEILEVANELDIKYDDELLFPIFEFEGEYLASVMSINVQVNCSPIVYITKIGEVSFKYPSLSTMLQVIARGYETGAYYVGRQGYIERNYTKIKEIMDQYVVVDHN